MARRDISRHLLRLRLMDPAALQKKSRSAVVA
jgi:hypothetical protein